MSDWDVIVVGAGPSGLTLAIDLGKRGIRTLLLEQASAPGPWPKMERCNARTMEFYRRIGLAERIRAAGFPGWVPMDVFIVTSLAEPPVLRIPFPSVNDYRARIASLNDGSTPLEPYQLVSQYALEPVLVEAAREVSNITLRFGCKVVGFHQDDKGVSVSFETADGHETANGGYLVGCDGGSSSIRKMAGIKLEGDGRLRRMTQVQFRSEGLFEAMRFGRGRHFQCFDKNSSTLIVQGNRKDFTLNSGLAEDSDFAPEIRRFIGFPIDFEVLRVNGWTQNLLVADRYRDRRVFIVGDSAHLVIPTGGLGMNTAVGDAFDLSWKLAGTINGWGGPALLDSYETERRRVAFVNREASRWAASGMAEWRRVANPIAFEQTAAGEAARSELAGVAYPLFRRVHEMHGTELGYHYHGSPIIASEEIPPPWHIARYTPSAAPGARLPHVWLSDGRPIFDLVGPSFTLIDLRGATDTAAIERAFASRGIELYVLRLSEPHIEKTYATSLLLVRPDLHIVWRGETPPADPDAVAMIATGHHLVRRIVAASASETAEHVVAAVKAAPVLYGATLDH